MRRALLALLCLGCSNDFDPPSLVVGPRLLAVVVSPPEAHPGEDITFRPLVANPTSTPLTLAWSVDLSTAALAAAAGQSLGEPAAPIALEWDGEVAVLPGQETQRALDALLAQIGEAAPGTSEHVVRFVYEEVGLVATVGIELRDEAGVTVLEGFKRFALTPRSERTTNPPPPRFAIDGRWVSGRAADSDSFECEPEGEAPEVGAGETILLAPDDDETWLETYPAIDLEGRVIENRESAYYSWYATAGTFAFATTRAPDASVEWTAPMAPGQHTIWLVVRDGHLGTSACRSVVHVVAP